MTQILEVQAGRAGTLQAPIRVADAVECFDPLLELKTVAKLTTLSPRQILRMVRAEKFPKPIKISDQRKAWRSSAVRTFIEEKERETTPRIAA